MLLRGAEIPKNNFFMLPRGAETPKSKFSCFRVARKRQKANLHASAWRGNTKKQIYMLPRGAETPKSNFSYFRVARKRFKRDDKRKPRKY